MTDNVATQVEQAQAEQTEQAAVVRTRAPAANFLPIVSGRLPLVFVHAIRFDPTLSGMSVKDVATKFATSVGKVFDIRKNRNFTYVTEDYVFSEEDFGTATQWASSIRDGASNKHGLTPTGDAELLDQIVDQYRADRTGDANALAAQAASRPARAPRKAKAEGEAAGKAETKAEAGGEAQAEDLLA